MPTALELSPEEWARYQQGALRRPVRAEPTPEERRLRDDLLCRIREAAEALKVRFGAKRVVLFGSLAHEAWFAPDSDVDLAVEGLASEDYWRAWRFVEEVIGTSPVDLIEIEIAGESLRRAIQRYGVEL